MSEGAFQWVLLVLALLNLLFLIGVILRPPSALSRGIRRSVDEDLRKGREEAGAAARNLREEVTRSIGSLGEGLARGQAGLTETLSKGQAAQNESLERIRTTLDARIRQLQEDNEKKLEEMRKTVDERLQGTLEKRLGESFRLVSDRLEAVQQGLGEMKNLATGVGDLKRVLTNVKSRGTWAEVQLGAILEEFLAPGQFERNVSTRRGSADVVEFAVRLPGRPEDPNSQVWLPIDSKFPQEDYLRLQDAAEQGDPEGVQRAADALTRTLKAEAQKIQEKYLDPPQTTDFGIMFLATEGLYAEALRQPDLVAVLQNKYRIVVAGPTTLAAILSSLRMGFQTLAIEKRASEVWEVLGAVKTEFAKFGEVLSNVKRQLGTVSRTIDQAEVRTRAMERRLRSVERLPEADARQVLALEADPRLARSRAEDDREEEAREATEEDPDA